MEIDKKTIQALAADTRLEILKSLAERRKMSSELARELDLAPSTIIEHLNILEDAELVLRKETGRKWIYYELTNKGENLIKPKFPVQFVVILSLGIMLFFAGFLNMTYISYEPFFYPITKTIEKVQPTVEAPVGPLITKNITENVTTYERVFKPISQINWIGIIILIVGIVLIAFALFRIAKVKKWLK